MLYECAEDANEMNMYEIAIERNSRHNENEQWNKLVSERRVKTLQRVFKSQEHRRPMPIPHDLMTNV